MTVRPAGWLLIALLLAGCGAALQPVIFLPEPVQVPAGCEFHSRREFTPASAAWLSDSGALALQALRATLMENRATVIAGLGLPDSAPVLPATWPAETQTGTLLVAPAGDRFLAEAALPLAGPRLWLQYDLTRGRAEYLYFVAH
ncbi:MAG TPA: hypothetical protein PKM88_05110 [bacterium]|nr:hypothetical protein [bacterium]